MKCLAMMSLAILAPLGRAMIVYSNNFENGSTAGFSYGAVSTAPNASTKFLGRFSGDVGNSSTQLSLTGLATHTLVTIELTLYTIHSWDGVSGQFGPDTLTFVADSTTLLDATFASDWGPQQSYSDATPLGGGPFPGQTDADAINNLGYSWYYGTNAAYNLSFTVAHTSSDLTVRFDSFNLQSLNDESWGIDDVVISTDAVPEPITILAFSTGLAALARRRRR